MEIEPIPQWYDGIKFRSTLEARWAVFFDAAGIRWQYEPEGFVIHGKPYRPDFLLPDCSTWIEVKGDPGRLDLELLCWAAIELPHAAPKYEAGPPLMILGDVPRPLPQMSSTEGYGDWGFAGMHQAYPLGFAAEDRRGYVADPSLPIIEFGYYGFGSYSKNLRPWWHDGFDQLPADAREASTMLLQPRICEWEIGVPEAYAAARAYRFGRQ